MNIPFDIFVRLVLGGLGRDLDESTEDHETRFGGRVRHLSAVQLIGICRPRCARADQEEDLLVFYIFPPWARRRQPVRSVNREC